MATKAHAVVAGAVERGELPRLGIDSEIACADCGAPAQAYDHRDYRYPLLVTPVCGGCNKRRGPGYPYNQ